jgi:hypothetical protein
LASKALDSLEAKKEAQIEKLLVMILRTMRFQFHCPSFLQMDILTSGIMKNFHGAPNDANSSAEIRISLHWVSKMHLVQTSFIKLLTNCQKGWPSVNIIGRHAMIFMHGVAAVRAPSIPTSIV